MTLEEPVGNGVISTGHVSGAGARAPPELMLSIFEHLRTTKSIPDAPHSLSTTVPAQKSLARAALVCQAWRDAATVHLYHSITLSSRPALAALTQTLARTAHGPLIHSIRIGEFAPDNMPPARWNPLARLTFPSGSLPVLETLQQKCPNLRYMALNVPRRARWVVPQVLSPDMFSNLTYLSIGPSPESEAHSIRGAMASGRLQLPLLEELLLAGSSIPYTANTATWSLMPRLRILTLRHTKSDAPSLRGLLECIAASLEELSFLSLRAEGDNFGFITWPLIPRLRRLVVADTIGVSDTLLSLVAKAAPTLEEILLLDMEIYREPWPAIPHMRRLAFGATHLVNAMHSRGYLALIGSAVASLKELSIRGWLHIQTQALIDVLWTMTDTLESLELLDSSLQTHEFRPVLHCMKRLRTLKLHVPHHAYEPTAADFFTNLPPNLQEIHMWAPPEGASYATRMAFFQIDVKQVCPHLREVHWMGKLDRVAEKEARRWCARRGLTFQMHEMRRFCNCFEMNYSSEVDAWEGGGGYHVSCVPFA